MSGDLDCLDFTRAFEYQWACLAMEYGVNEALKIRKPEADH